ATDVWVVGSNTQAAGNITAHWNGTTWTAYADTLFYSPLAILPLADNDVWVAYNGSGNARHYDGIRWTYVQNVAVPGVSFGSLLATPSELVAISFDGVAYRFSGQVYAQLAADTGNVDAVGVLWSDAPDDVYVGDGSGSVLHFDGQKWTTTAVASGAIVALWGTRGDDVWAVARVATNASPVFHYDGVGWTNPPGITSAASAVWGSAKDDVWFLGSFGVYHYDGSSITASLAIAGEKISGTGPDDVWVTGGSVTAGGAAYHSDGAAWSAPTQLAHHVNALVAVAPNDVFASGDGSHVMHYDGTTWSDTQLLVFDPLTNASASAPDDVYVASATTIFQFDGSRWARVRSPSDSALGGETLAALSAHRGWIDLLYTSATNTQQVRKLVRTRPWNCRASETDCDDGVDDDCDGMVDHLDPDCP
ncbi:MAG: hypothetical protein ACM31C_32810, partial [Acidobacteriota bacterium]